MTRPNRTTMLALLAGALVAPAAAQPFESAIGGPFDVRDVIDDTVWVAGFAGALPSGPVSAGWINGDGATFGADDMYIVRQDGAGSILWDTILSTPEREQANEITNTFDLGFAVVGETDIFAGGPALASLGVSLTMLDASGAQLFSRLYFGSPFIGGTQGGADVHANSDGGYAISARAAAPIVPVFQAPVAIRTDAGGFPLWSNYYVDPILGIDNFGSFADIHEFIAADGTSNFIATGYMADFDGSTGSRDTLVVRLDSAGGVIWSNLYRFPYGEEGLGIEITDDSRIIITGRDSYDDGTAAGCTSFMMELTPGGAVVWYNRYFGFAAVDGSVREIPGGRLVTTGVCIDPDSALGTTEALLMNTSPAGVPLLTFGYGGDRDEAGDAVDLSSDGFVIGAHTNSFAFGLEDFYVLRTDAAGKTGCERDRQIDFQPLQPQLVQLQLRPKPRQENVTWLWDELHPNHPVEIVCDPNPCPTCAADFALPLGVSDFSDVVAFLGLFASMDPCADLALPTGVWDFSDVVAFLSTFGVPCP